MPSRPTGFLFFVGYCAAVITTAANIERQSDLAAQSFLADDRFDLAHQVGVLAQVILGVLTSLAEADIAIGEEGAALLDDFELGGQVEHIARLWKCLR